jgi:hypothetical protein
VEANETLFLNLSGAVNGTIADPQGIGTIANDDVAVVPSITVNDVTVAEGNAGTVNLAFVVSLSASPTAQVTVNYATANGTTNPATAGSDYVAASGTLTFAANTPTLTQTVNVAVNGDTTVEPNETLFLNLSAPAGATIADPQGIGTITNDDTAPPAGGLVLSLGFEETAGTTVLDSSPSALSGTINGATRVAGRVGNALQFNGAGNWVTVNDPGTGSPLDLTTGMTIEAWVNPTALGGAWRTVAMKEQLGGLAYGLWAHDGARPTTYIFIGGDRGLAGGTALPLNVWSHVVATYDGATQRLYVNGVQVAQRAQTGAMVQSNNPFRIGGSQPFGEFFQGRIDEVKVYNRALTAAEIAAAASIP